MHELRTVAFNDPWRLSVCTCVCLSCGFTRLRCAKTVERIKVLLGLETYTDSRSIVLDGHPNFSHGFDAAFA